MYFIFHCLVEFIAFIAECRMDCWIQVTHTLFFLLIMMMNLLLLYKIQSGASFTEAAIPPRCESTHNATHCVDHPVGYWEITNILQCVSECSDKKPLNALRHLKLVRSEWAEGHRIELVGFWLVVCACVHSTKICILQVKLRHFWKLRMFWLVLSTSQAYLRVKTWF